jgi:chromosome segregation ATPase
VSLAVAWNATTKARNADQASISRDQTVEQHVTSLNKRLSQAEETNAQLRDVLNIVTRRLKVTQSQITTAERQNQSNGVEYSKKLDSVQSELAAKASADDLKVLGGDVSGVKNDLQATKSDLEATKNSLGATRDEFGNLIAHNHDEIDQLRRQGERDYFEFTLAGKGNRSKVGQLMVELRGTNPKKNQFTVALYVDDVRVEKTNRSLDEPIYFYKEGMRVPLELVVNQVAKNKIKGYLSAPKAQPSSAAKAAS